MAFSGVDCRCRRADYLGAGICVRDLRPNEGVPLTFTRGLPCTRRLAQTTTRDTDHRLVAAENGVASPQEARVSDTRAARLAGDILVLKALANPSGSQAS
jgi:hypothetical protein